mmetsp:Transcript_66472/g.206224  ORF Transcript_66472/g.206224 Transcript_66472/m.206224 type:complete len:307 (+) Transcript_66472:605-1525(+)
MARSVSHLACPPAAPLYHASIWLRENVRSADLQLCERAVQHCGVGQNASRAAHRQAELPGLHTTCGVIPGQLLLQRPDAGAPGHHLPHLQADAAVDVNREGQLPTGGLPCGNLLRGDTTPRPLLVLLLQEDDHAAAGPVHPEGALGRHDLGLAEEGHSMVRGHTSARAGDVDVDFASRLGEGHGRCSVQVHHARVVRGNLLPEDPTPQLNTNLALAALIAERERVDGLSTLLGQLLLQGSKAFLEPRDKLAPGLVTHFPHVALLDTSDLRRGRQVQVAGKARPASGETHPHRPAVKHPAPHTWKHG